MPPGNSMDEYVWVEGNDFCCICAWWHMPPLQYDHEAMLCPRCLIDWVEDPTLRDRDSPVTPALKRKR